MSDILQYKAFSNKIEEALNEKVIGDVNVKYNFDPSAFGMTIMVAIDDPTKKQAAYYKDPRWHYRVTLDEHIIMDSFDEIVSDILDKYKEHVYKRYFFD